MEKNIDFGNDEIFSQQERENILEKVKNFYENKLVEKNELEWQGFFGQILCRVKIFIFRQC
ncbi:hypothetical protein [Spiroplasma poulsonii]|uniref:hypothetical protein n=1 Tax=Spiroplasma poulsonii TaxID=2138 RepID=UPI001F4CAA8E|nr:hypothetical protein [Spiroplasma poulsonii]UNF62307.1 hypothetical protein MNU24_02260 [Spiroplasma poulsonii]